MSHQLNLSTARGSCSSASFRVAHRHNFHDEFPFPFAPFRAYTQHWTPRARQLSPYYASRKENGGARKSWHTQNWRRPPLGSPHLPLALRPAKWRAQRNTFTREGKGSGIITAGYIWDTRRVCTLFSMVSAPGPLFRRPSTRKLGGTNERASFILLITSDFAPIVGIKFVRFVSMNETHCRAISPALPLLFHKCESRIRCIERLLDS